MDRRITATGAGIATLLIGLAAVGFSIVVVEVLDVFPDALSYLILPIGGILAIIGAVVAARTFYNRSE